jgi:hypothetical protein
MVCLGHTANQHHAADRQNQQANSNAVGKLPRNPIKQTTSNWARNGGYLPSHGIERDAVGQGIFGKKVGRQCVGSWVHEGPCRSKSHKDQKDRPDLLETGEREYKQAKCAGNFNQQAKRDDQPAVELVGNEPGDQHQQQRRQELRQAHKTQVQRIAGKVIDLPPHGNGHDLHSKAGGAQGRQIKNIGSVMKGI